MDPYVYKGTDILKNKMSIKDEKELIDIEAQLFIANMLDLPSIVKDLDMRLSESVQHVHRFLFHQIYSWAGKFRTVNIHKSEPVLGGVSVSYSDRNQIKQDLRNLFNWVNTIHWSNDNNNLAEDLASFMTELWRIHPFREGNTRTTSVFINLFVVENDIVFDGDILSQHPGYLRKALVLAAVHEAPEPQHLLKMLKDALGLLEIDEEKQLKTQSDRYNVIKQYDVSKYKPKPFKTYYSE